MSRFDQPNEETASPPVIRPCSAHDFDAMLAVVNAAARAYGGVIPADCYGEPYMPAAELRGEIAAGVRFWASFEADVMVGIMGIQDVDDMTLIRHAYVRPDRQRKGVGSRLLQHLLPLTMKVPLVGTWADAWWAISFYERHGFSLVAPAEKDQLLRRYWTISERQVETSVVLRAGPSAWAGGRGRVHVTATSAASCDSAP
jgi:GNAT superfamily N-acetyltransferase